MVRGIENGDWDTVGLSAAGVGLDALGLVADPLGTLFSWGFGWMIENVPFLREPFDALMGNPDAIAGSAATWTNIGTEVKSVATDYRASIAETSDWTGLAGDSYRALAGVHADGIEQVGEAASGMASAVQGAGVLVGAVRGIVRDLIAQACGDIAAAFVKWGIASLLTAGIAVGGMVADGIRLALKWADKIREWVDKLGTALTNLLSKLDELGSGTHQIGTKIGNFFQNAQAPGSATIADSAPTPNITLESLTDGTNFKPSFSSPNSVLPTGETGNIPVFTPGDDYGVIKTGYEGIKEGAKIDDGIDAQNDN
ncbi:hypothetical protein [Actinoalloteichus hymeniacidonis]|uniref:hypothetical protein n=1 Tax=Actinoalloteichus hymeniacidonis TaxID=340345 RepID=UPI0017E346E6|nr:hypothetical protein [Actinoalloteichus hymeniacidonis]MBB5910890.1 hypothetical protein [Actinoalloteichus hymeniacidonis]